MDSTQTEAEEAPASQELRIVLIGRSEAGKSSIGNVILGREVFRESRTRESEIQRGRVEDRNISIIDTPGFFNTQLTDEEQQKQMMKSLELSHPGPHVFLLVIRLDRFTEDVGKTVKTIYGYFGRDAFRFTMVLFTGREAMSKRQWIEFRFDRKTRELLSFCEEKCHVIIHKNKRDKKQIASLLENIDEVVRKNGREHYTKHITVNNSEEETMKDRKEKMKISQKKEQENRTEETENCVQKDQRSTNEENQTLLIREEEKTTPENHSGKASDLRIVLLGKRGSGKSSTANTILGRGAGFPSNPQSCGEHEADVCGRNISVVDAPVLFDPALTRAQLKTCVEMTDPGPHVFLLVIRLDERLTDEEKNTVEWIQENFGADAVHHTVVLFTHADHLKGKPLDEFIRDTPDLQAITEAFGGRFHSFNNTDVENGSQVFELLEKIERMLEENGGKHYSNETLMKNQEETEKEKDEEVKENTSNWFRGVFVFLIGALAAAAVAKSGLEG